jgi:hypothetical protein
MTSAIRFLERLELAGSFGSGGGFAGAWSVGLGAGLEDVGVEGDAVDNGSDQAGVGNAVPHSLSEHVA